LSPGGVLEALLYPLGTGIEIAEAIVDVEKALVNDAILLLMVLVRVALRIVFAVGRVASKTG
jgi:hypothetical protein